MASLQTFLNTHTKKTYRFLNKNNFTNLSATFLIKLQLKRSITDETLRNFYNVVVRWLAVALTTNEQTGYTYFEKNIFTGFWWQFLMSSISHWVVANHSKLLQPLAILRILSYNYYVMFTTFHWLHDMIQQMLVEQTLQYDTYHLHELHCDFLSFVLMLLASSSTKNNCSWQPTMAKTHDHRQ